MAVPFRNAQTAQVTGQTLTITAPTGMASGDVLIALISSFFGCSIEAPSGWSALGPLQQPGGTGGYGFGLSGQAFSHIAGGSEPGSYVFSTPGKLGVTSGAIAA